jgi:hypothetical protein
MIHRDPYHDSPRGWGLGSTIAALSIAFVALVFVLMYGMSNQSSPVTAGQGGSPPAPVIR